MTGYYGQQEVNEITSNKQNLIYMQGKGITRQPQPPVQTPAPKPTPT